MKELKEKALDKLNIDLAKPHSNTIEKIHNWICEQEDEELFSSILKDGKSIDGAMEFCCKNARKQVQEGNCAIVPDEEVYKWIKDYFILDQPKEEIIQNVKPKITNSATVSISLKVKAKKDEVRKTCQEQLALF